MPIYDFQCTSCGFKNELMRKISEASTITCPNCQKETFAKMLSAPSFQLSGSGWYASDFKDKKPNKNQENSHNSAEKSEAKSETKSADAEAKTAACNPGCACH
jgi:putative FmdB family regulatory protein